MACKSEDYNYVVIEELTDVASALTEIRRHALLAVDCKGFELGGGRSGELTVITVATSTKVFIFDVLILGKQLFDDGLRALLEDKAKDKLMFDCRRVADNLRHQLNVELSGVLDLQLLEVMRRERRTPKREEGSRRCLRTDELQLTNGVLRCIEEYVKDQAMVDAKKRCQRQVVGDSHVWKTRPLSQNLKNYCCVDTSGLFILYQKLEGDGRYMPRLRVASDRYADIFRCMPTRAYGIVQTNFLPLDIIPEDDSLEFPAASTKCIGCLRLFPVDEFCKSQLRNKKRYCRVCETTKNF